MDPIRWEMLFMLAIAYLAVFVPLLLVIWLVERKPPMATYKRKRKSPWR